MCKMRLTIQFPMQTANEKQIVTPAIRSDLESRQGFRRQILAGSRTLLKTALARISRPAGGQTLITTSKSKTGRDLSSP